MVRLASQPEDAGPRAPVRQAPPCRAHFGTGLIALRAGGLPFQPAGGPVGAGLEDVSALPVRPHAAPPPMGTRPEEQGSRKGRRCGEFGVSKKRLRLIQAKVRHGCINAFLKFLIAVVDFLIN